MVEKWNIRPLAATWCEAMAAAGFDDSAAQQVLNAVRDSPPEAKLDREQFYKTLAHQSVSWHRATLAGKTLEPDVLLKVVKLFKEQQAAG